MTDVLLVLNTGSSSLKFQAFERQGLNVLLAGKVTGIGTGATLATEVGDVATKTELGASDHEAALEAVLAFIDRNDDAWTIRAVVHRVVHGGVDFVSPLVVTPEILERLEALNPLAPLHQPFNISGIRASHRLAGGAPDIACFDTAFHAGRADIFETFAIEKPLRDKGIRRYGFHGLSYQWIVHLLKKDRPELAGGRVVAAHLGNGASLCAIRDGRSIDTTMGMTALDGIPMGTRSGALDPGAVTFMMRELGMDAAAIEESLYERAGLRGLSGLTNDVAGLLRSDDPRAALALDHFALKVAQHAAMMAVSMGGIDTLVFTGGIGENAAPVRAAILARLSVLGAFETLVIPANEERMMAIQARDLLA